MLTFLCFPLSVCFVSFSHSPPSLSAFWICLFQSLFSAFHPTPLVTTYLLRNLVMDHVGIGGSSSVEIDNRDSSVEITCFTDVLDDATLHFQIIRLHKQIYAWIGYKSAKLGHLFAAAPTRPDNTPSVTAILGGAPDNTGSGIARRLVLRTGLNVILACSLPKNNPLIEAEAGKKLVAKLINLGYAQSRPKD
ncbi:hypothetical protein Nepgr_013643 [Nepenthes gracilis]|uniref:Proteasome assembly chaperone 4 n=1 Tax=Nepenthes gracilis TaxID=150966 RepID=A0AAD3XNU8_NEPGR|nr:hypothetical protein Nepgr_013643 [Nepenthes gracilis]